MVISVIVCTRNRGYAIAPCLDSIAAAFTAAALIDAEIVVVDNGSTDDTQAIVDSWARGCAFPLRLVSEPVQGQARARNAGMRAARGDLLVFTDDDCRLSADYVKDLLRRDALNAGLVVRSGRIELGDPTDLPLTVKTLSTPKRWHRQKNVHMAPPMNSGKPRKVPYALVGCNMALRREVAMRIGPFDERFGPGTIPGVDDVDWALRAYRAGIALEEVPDMVVFHHHGRKLPSEGYNLLRNYAIAHGALCAKYLFKAPVQFCYELYQDIGGAIKELFFGKTELLAKCNFSRGAWLRYSVVGAVRYVSLVLRGAPGPSRIANPGRTAERQVISVIVCTRNRASAITPCLDSIAASFTAAAPLDAEIVVVDNASTDDTQAVVKAWASTCPFPVRLVVEQKLGLSAAHNKGMATAKGDLLVFTDDDCRLSVDYVKDLLRRFAADTEPVLRSGRIELGDPTDLPLSIHTDPRGKHWHRQANCPGKAKMLVGRPGKLSYAVWGCNMATRRETAKRIGPFDERFGPGAGIPAADDSDWAFRAYLVDIAVEYVPDMVVFHHHGRKLQTHGYSLLRNYAIAQGALWTKYLFKAPILCYDLYRDIGGSIKELFFGRNELAVRCGFSRRRWLGYATVGAWRYVLLVLKGVPESSQAESRDRNADAAESRRSRDWLEEPRRGAPEESASDHD